MPQNMRLILLPLARVKGRERVHIHNEVLRVGTPLHALAEEIQKQRIVNRIAPMIKQLAERARLLGASGLLTVDSVESLVHHQVECTDVVRVNGESHGVVAVPGRVHCHCDQ